MPGNTTGSSKESRALQSKASDDPVYYSFYTAKSLTKEFRTRKKKKPGKRSTFVMPSTFSSASNSNTSSQPNHTFIQKAAEQQTEQPAVQPSAIPNVHPMEDIGGSESEWTHQKDLDLIEFWGKFHSHIRDVLAHTLSKEQPFATVHANTDGCFVDFIMGIMEVYLSSNMCKSTANQLLRLIECYFSKILNTRLSLNINTLLKKVKDVSKEFEKVHYCNEHGVCDIGSTTCTQCNKDCTSNMFWARSIQKSVCSMVDNIGLTTFKSVLVNPSTDGFINDSVDGVEYERITKDWKSSEDLCLTLVAAADLGSTSKSSSKSMTTLIGNFAEIALDIRFSYPLTLLMAYCSQKIPLNYVIHYMVSELQQLDIGVKCRTRFGEEFKLKVRLLNFLCDLVACKDLLQMTGHGSACSCRFCKKIGCSFNDRFIFDSQSPGNFRSRDWKGILEIYLNNTFPREGVLAKTILVNLPYFQWTKQVSCDILHNMFEGLCKKVLKKVVSTSSKQHIAIINGE